MITPPPGFRIDAFADARMGVSLFQMSPEDWLVPDDNRLPDRQPIAEAPRDGTVILGLYEDGTTDRIRWDDDRRCAGEGPMACQGAGWASLDAGGLPVDEPPEWTPESNLTGCLDPDRHRGRCGYSTRREP